MTRSYEVVIAGGGIMGAAAAYFLTADPDFDGRVLIVERDPTYGAAATTRSWGGLRQQFSTAENIRMSLFGVDFVRRASALLAVEGEGPDLAFREHGYLFLASPDGLAVLERNLALQRRLGATVARLTPPDLSARFPWLDTSGVAAAGFGPVNEGWIDPNALLHGLRRKALAQGAQQATDTVIGVERRGGQVRGVVLRDGGEIACATLVNAAGPQAGALAALAGVALPVRPRKRTTFVFDCRTRIAGMPLTIDTSGVAVRPEGAQFIAIVSPPAAEDRDAEDLEPDYALFESTIWPTLARRIPAFAAIKLTGAWAGHYDFNTFDQNAIVGWHPDCRGLMLCNGFSGHGLQQAPAAGRAVAELIVHGAFRSLDLSALSYERIAAGQPLSEKNIV